MKRKAILCLKKYYVLCYHVVSAETVNNVVIDTVDGAVETISDVEPIVTIQSKPLLKSTLSSKSSLYNYYISNVNKIIYNLFEPLTTYVTGGNGASISYTKGRSVSFSAEYSLGCSVDLYLVQAETSSTLGKSSTVEASETVTYSVPSGYKGRIVLRYYRDYYTFKVTEVYNGNYQGTYDGSGKTAVYDSYYTLQCISIS